MVRVESALVCEIVCAYFDVAGNVVKDCGIA